MPPLPGSDENKPSDRKKDRSLKLPTASRQPKEGEWLSYSSKSKKNLKTSILLFHLLLHI